MFRAKPILAVVLLIDRLAEHGQITTSIVLSTPIARRIVTRELYLTEQEQE
jgi:hypothetical protein